MKIKEFFRWVWNDFPDYLAQKIQEQADIIDKYVIHRKETLLEEFEEELREVEAWRAARKK